MVQELQGRLQGGRQDRPAGQGLVRGAGEGAGLQLQRPWAGGAGGGRDNTAGDGLDRQLQIWGQNSKNISKMEINWTSKLAKTIQHFTQLCLVLEEEEEDTYRQASL